MPICVLVVNVPNESPLLALKGMGSDVLSKKDVAFGNRLKRFRGQVKLTQEELAEKIGLSRDFIALLETGRRRPSVKTIQKLSKALHVKSSDLLSY